jgi:formate transporter
MPMRGAISDAPAIVPGPQIDRQATATAFKRVTIREANDTAGSTPSVKPTALGDLTPGEAAQRLIEWSVTKATLSTQRLIMLGVLAGICIAFGGAFFTAVISEVSLGNGPSRLLGGVAFSLGLLLVCTSGAELSTGNCMIFAAWAARRLTFQDITRNLLISYAANAVGALVLVLLIVGSGLLQTEHGRIAAALAEAKMNLSFGQAFCRGVLCNALVCLAVWMILAGQTIPSKLLGLLFPISAFITLGFENSIANLYLLPVGLLAGAAGSLTAAVSNLIAVTLGNLVGGVGIALAFWMAYLRPETSRGSSPHLSSSGLDDDNA